LLLEVAGRRSRSGTRQTVRGVARVRVESIESRRPAGEVIRAAAYALARSCGGARGRRRPGRALGDRGGGATGRRAALLALGGVELVEVAPARAYGGVRG
jgi:hypothetical protein